MAVCKYKQVPPLRPLQTELETCVYNISLCSAWFRGIISALKVEPRVYEVYTIYSDGHFFFNEGIEDCGNLLRKCIAKYQFAGRVSRYVRGFSLPVTDAISAAVWSGIDFAADRV